MLRQRLRARRPTLTLVGNVLVFLLACALVFYGAILLLLALKLVSASALDSVSGYRAAYDELAGLQESDLGGTLRLVAGLLGPVAFLVFAYLAFKQLPRPYLARHELRLADEQEGVVTVEPRAIERVAETAALQHRSISAAAGRYGPGELTLNVSTPHATNLAPALREAQQQVVAALEQHGLPPTQIHLNLTGYERRTRRELD